MTIPTNPLFNQPSIVPVAISSQLSDDGEERIHVAPYRTLATLPAPYPIFNLSGDLPDGIIGLSLGTSYIAVGGTPPYVNYAVTAGTLPSGLSLSASTGVVTGIPTVRGTYNWTVQVTDTDELTTTVDDTSQICEFIVGEQTNEVTLGADVRVADIFADNTGLHCTYGSYGISIGGNFTRELRDFDLSIINSANVTVLAGSPGDGRLWLNSESKTGWGIAQDDNFSFGMLWQNGQFKAKIKPDASFADQWFAPLSPGLECEWAGLHWFDNDFAYVGVRVRQAVNHRRIYKFALAASGGTAFAVATSPLLTPTSNGYFINNLSRDGVLRVIDLEGANLMTLSTDDLSILDTRSIPFSLAGARAFTVDYGKIVIYHGSVSPTFQPKITVWKLSDLSFVSEHNVTGSVNDFNNKLVLNDDSIFLKTGFYLKRFGYTKVCTP